MVKVAAFPQSKIMQNNEFEITTKLRGFDLTFKTTYDLFSYRKIDKGTKLLIKNIVVPSGATCLDLGCGYGPIGITLAKMNPKGQVYLVDKDFTAIEYAKKNCKTNSVSNCHVVLGNGFNQVKNIKFDLVASNLPTHIASQTRKKFFTDAKKSLKKDGEIYMVTVNKLASFMQKAFSEIFGSYKALAKNSTHTLSFVRKK